MAYIYYKGSGISDFIFKNTNSSILWLVIRIYVGWSWLVAGWDKIINPAWFGSNAGAGITGFLNGSLTKTGGAHPDVSMWYAWFIQHVVLPYAHIWSYVITIGEVLIGAALILGIFTGIAAFFGSFMNLNFMLAGSVSVNPILFVLGMGVCMAWRVAGYYGVDHYLLPYVQNKNNKTTS